MLHQMTNVKIQMHIKSLDAQKQTQSSHLRYSGIYSVLLEILVCFNIRSNMFLVCLQEGMSADFKVFLLLWIQIYTSPHVEHYYWNKDSADLEQSWTLFVLIIYVPLFHYLESLSQNQSVYQLILLLKDFVLKINHLKNTCTLTFQWYASIQDQNSSELNIKQHYVI